MFRADPRSVNQLDFHDFDDGFEPGRIINDYVGPAMELVRGALCLGKSDRKVSQYLLSAISLNHNVGNEESRLNNLYNLMNIHHLR